jgi:hypothetical protein
MSIDIDLIFSGVQMLAVLLLDTYTLIYFKIRLKKSKKVIIKILIIYRTATS